MRLGVNAQIWTQGYYEHAGKCAHLMQAHIPLKGTHWKIDAHTLPAISPVNPLPREYGHLYHKRIHTQASRSQDRILSILSPRLLN